MTSFTSNFPSSFIGFNKLISDVSKLNSIPNYPPHEIIEFNDHELISNGKHRFVLSIAVAGFTRDEISIREEDKIVYIEGIKENKYAVSENVPKYVNVLYSNLSHRDFKLKFKLAEHITVNDCKLENGILSIELVDDTPEPLVKKFEIK